MGDEGNDAETSTQKEREEIPGGVGKVGGVSSEARTEHAAGNDCRDVGAAPGGGDGSGGGDGPTVERVSVSKAEYDLLVRLYWVTRRSYGYAFGRNELNRGIDAFKWEVGYMLHLLAYVEVPPMELEGFAP